MCNKLIYLLSRSGVDGPLPNGESLKDVVARIVPYWESVLAPQADNK